jgi:hypothetical protein
MSDLDRFIDAYIECALWSTNDESTPQGGEPLDKNYGPEDIHPDTLAEMREDCEDFMQANAADLDDFDPEYCGHDFWLTRNHHGAGFWDGDYPEDIGRRLTETSHVYGEVNLIVGEDGLIHSY